MSWKYILIGNNVPLDSLLKSDFAKAVQRAEELAEYMRTTVNVLRVNGTEVEWAMTVSPPTPQEK